MRALAPLLLVASWALFACGDDDGPAPEDASAPDARAEDAGVDAGPMAMDWPAEYPPRSTVPAEGVRRDLFLVRGVTAPANPETGEATPEQLGYTQVVRYRRDVDPPAPARAIVVAMPGFLGGGPSFEGLARAMVRLGLDGEPIEVWAIDRRSNLLEDLRGMDAAEEQGNPEIAQGYYFGDDTIGGEAFGGYVPQGDVSFMSEWGLATHVEDLRRVIALVPEAERQQRVFLMGHSLGASFTEAYAAWRFEDGTRGVEELAGLVLIDGALGDAPSTEEAYLEGSSAGGFPSPGLEGIRTGNQRYTTLPLLGIDVYARAEISSLRALVAPDEVVEDFGRARVLGTLMGLRVDRVPPMTNEAALAVAFDDEFQPLGFVRAKLGHLVGPTETYESALAGGAELLRPSDPEAEVSWEDALEADPNEYTPVRNLAESFAHGRSNFAEWYFPTRLPLDLSAVGGAAVAEDGWQAALGLRAFDGGLIDAPILAIANGLVGDPERFEAIRERVAATVGEGRPAAGVARSDERAFQVVDAVDLEHLDPVFADENTPGNPVPEAVLGFVAEHAAEGTVAVERME
ncbi:MAG TPA: hypothetical protein RMH85_02295 [Polyangiaceae bacterium LLY-WYZ-15_(1-7)]|nr:hypothetical protein [Myxococcales bacterium]MAT28737.1 hypothetical protein [Sandaracinus sp.]HJK93106.1 hypothetical protein [Polyangiaceae bacterium LLY-WYZ-15_(1-7)]HJL00983.1 hypothetical protein [Polyangiaceae bacterium LLY-WYZ-15_(1-7)]HJL07297.1 hypothetical protein [Polyangiaceae bacterium LLY-WYZ-15_(1-7)]